jgi:hypothetical protein
MRLTRRAALGLLGAASSLAGCSQVGYQGRGDEPTTTDDSKRPSSRDDAEAADTDPFRSTSLSNLNVVGGSGFAGIQAAHNDLPPTGGTILVADEIRESDIRITKPVKLTGSMGGGIFTRETPTILDASGGTGLTIEHPLVVLEDLRITGDRTPGSVGIDTPSNGLTPAGDEPLLHDSWKLRNVQVDNFDIGVRLSSINGPRFDPLTVCRCATDGIQFVGRHSSDWLNAATGHIRAYKNGRDGIRIDYSTGDRFSGNYLKLQLENTRGWGVHLLGGKMSGC